MKVSRGVATRLGMWVLIGIMTSSVRADLIITGIYDGPLAGGLPKGIELYAVADIPDLSIYALGSANNGGGSDGEEFFFPDESSADAGDYIYVTSDEVGFDDFFGILPDYVSGAMLINGDDAIELFSEGNVVDVFGEIDVDGSGQPWEYTDGWAYRTDGTGPDSSLFVFDSWSFSGADALDDELDNDTALTPMPIGTYQESGDLVLLQAGDADQDLDFDQFDLIQVQVAGKYLTAEPATWGDGDWDGAPGGSVGNPPLGSGRFDQLDIVAALDADIYFKGKYGALHPEGQVADAQTTVGYDAGTGEVWVDAPAGTQLTSINIESAYGIFTGEPARNLGGSFDNDADQNIFKATFGDTFGSLSFGNVAQVGLDEELLLNDLTVVGSVAGGGGLGDVDLVYVPVPEPSTIVLLAVALVGLVTTTYASAGRPTGRGTNRR